MPILKIPMDNYQIALRDTVEFARNFACIPPGAVSPFLGDWQKVQQCFDHSRNNPFDSETMLFDPDFNIDDKYNHYMHIDYGPKINATGIACCHVPGFKKVIVSDEKSKQTMEVDLPIVYYDFLGKIFAPKDQIVELPDIRELVIYELAKRGGQINLISMDGYNSSETLSILNREGFPSDVLSIDHTSAKLIVDWSRPNKVRRVSTSGNYAAAWQTFKDLIMDGRINMPYIQDFEVEMKHAERRIKNNRINVTCQSSVLALDLMEAMAGAAFNAINNEWETPLAEEEIINARDKEDAHFYDIFNRSESFFEKQTDDRLFYGDGEDKWI